MLKSQYESVLKTDRWQRMRKRVLHARPFCRACKLPRWLAVIAYDQDLHVHHRSYANRGTEREIDDLEPLCRRCHEIETFGRSDLRAPKAADCSTCGTVHWNPWSDHCSSCASDAPTAVDRKQPKSEAWQPAQQIGFWDSSGDAA